MAWSIRRDRTSWPVRILPILPARPRRPRDKAKVEVAVLIIERWLHAACVDALPTSAPGALDINYLA
jgi:hypothetical protein